MSPSLFWIGLVLCAVGSIFTIIGGLLVKDNWGYWNPPIKINTYQSSYFGIGGKGGNATVNGNGIAIGGPGGHGGKYGNGGYGGSAEVQGDGIAAGGAGGAAGDDGIWRAPAKSGYEIMQRALNLPVDPYIRKFGRGGAVPGYEPKLAIIEEMRNKYFEENSQKTESIFENINAVPLDYLNKALIRQEINWRVRIIDDEYEFYDPNMHE